MEPVVTMRPFTFLHQKNRKVSPFTPTLKAKGGSLREGGGRNKELSLWSACWDGAKEEAMPLISDPETDVNWTHRLSLRTPLHNACRKNHADLVALLLKRKDLDPSKKGQDGETPLYVACQNGAKEVVSLLLADQRVDPNEAVEGRETPLWVACFLGQLEVVEIMLASPRRIDAMKSNWRNSPAQSAKTRGWAYLAALVEAYANDPQPVRLQLRRKLAWDEDIFALTILFADGYLTPKQTGDEETEPTSTKESSAKRFFKITSKLPIELQMSVVRKVYLSRQNFFLSHQTEPALKRVLAQPYS